MQKSSSVCGNMIVKTGGKAAVVIMQIQRWLYVRQIRYQLTFGNGTVGDSDAGSNAIR